MVLDIALAALLVSAGVMALAGVKALVRDVSRLSGTAERPAPDRTDLLVDVAMTLLGIAGVAGALGGFGAW
jgi:hypothetical protein